MFNDNSALKLKQILVKKGMQGLIEKRHTSGAIEVKFHSIGGMEDRIFTFEVSRFNSSSQLFIVKLKLVKYQSYPDQISMLKPFDTISYLESMLEDNKSYLSTKVSQIIKLNDSKLIKPYQIHSGIIKKSTFEFRINEQLIIEGQLHPSCS